MESIYIVLFIFFAVPAAFLEWSDNACFGLLSSSRGQQHKQEYLRFRNNYVVVFSLMMGEVSGFCFIGKPRAPVDRLFRGKPARFGGHAALHTLGHTTGQHTLTWQTGCMSCLLSQHAKPQSHSWGCCDTLLVFLVCCSWRLAAGAVCVSPLRILWLQRA